MYIVHVHFLGLKEANDVAMYLNLKCFKRVKMNELERNFFNPTIQVNVHNLGKISAPPPKKKLLLFVPALTQKAWKPSYK